MVKAESGKLWSPHGAARGGRGGGRARRGPRRDGSQRAAGRPRSRRCGRQRARNGSSVTRLGRRVLRLPSYSQLQELWQRARAVPPGGCQPGVRERAERKQPRSVGHDKNKAQQLRLGSLASPSTQLWSCPPPRPDPTHPHRMDGGGGGGSARRRRLQAAAGAAAERQHRHWPAAHHSSGRGSEAAPTPTGRRTSRLGGRSAAATGIITDSLRRCRRRHRRWRGRPTPTRQRPTAGGGRRRGGGCSGAGRHCCQPRLPRLWRRCRRSRQRQRDGRRVVAPQWLSAAAVVAAVPPPRSGPKSTRTRGLGWTRRASRRASLPSSSPSFSSFQGDDHCHARDGHWPLGVPQLHHPLSWPPERWQATDGEPQPCGTAWRSRWVCPWRPAAKGPWTCGDERGSPSSTPRH